MATVPILPHKNRNKPVRMTDRSHNRPWILDTIATARSATEIAWEYDIAALNQSFDRFATGVKSHCARQNLRVLRIQPVRKLRYTEITG